MEKIIFDRNHVKITVTKKTWEGCRNTVSLITEHRSTVLGDASITVKKFKYENVIKESPLGFYYRSKEKVEYDEQEPIRAVITYRRVFINTPSETYMIEYPIECNDVKVGFDSRPYDICVGDKSIPNHVINAMKDKLDDIFENSSSAKHIQRAKNTVYTELFGNVNGLSSLPNDIKILSHGFDPKESFRKRKKEKKK